MGWGEGQFGISDSGGVSRHEQTCWAWGRVGRRANVLSSSTMLTVLPLFTCVQSEVLDMVEGSKR